MKAGMNESVNGDGEKMAQKKNHYNVKREYNEESNIHSWRISISPVIRLNLTP